MAADTKELLIELQLQNKQLIKAVSETDTKLGKLNKTQDKTKKLVDKIKVGYIAVAGVITGIVAKGLGFLIKKASDAQETLSKFNTVFRDIRDEADEVAKNLVDNFGLSGLAARTLLSDTGDLLTGFGFTQKEALNLSEQVNTLAVDLASFTNFSGGAEGASQALTKALLGEREMVKSLGISIMEADIKQLAKDQGIVGELTRQQKAMLTLQIAVQQSGNAIGDFQRTSKDFANQVRIAKGRLEDWAVVMGSKLLPVFAPFVGLLNDAIQPEKDLLGLTKDLIKFQDEYKGILEKLKDEQIELTNAEKTDLKIRKQIIELDILTTINELNKAYEKNKQELEVANNFSTAYGIGLQSLRHTLANTKDETITLSNAQASLLGVMQTVNLATGETTRATIGREQALKKLASINERVAAQDLKTAELEKIRQEAIDTIAVGLNNEVITKGDLLGINQEIIDQAIERQEQVALDQEKKKENAEEDVEINQLTKDQISETNALFRESEKLAEDATLQEKINRIDVLLETAKKGSVQEKKLLASRVAFEKKMQEEIRKEASITNKLKKSLATDELQATQTALSSISTLTSSENKKLFKIGKAAALADATISAAQAILKTMSSVPFPFNIPLAALQGVAAGVQIDKISNTQFVGKKQGGVIDRVMGSPINGEDGMIGVRLGESVLNEAATMNLGKQTIDNLNAGKQGGGMNVHPTFIISNNRPEETVTQINNYLRRFGTSDRGEAL